VNVVSEMAWGRITGVSMFVALMLKPKIYTKHYIANCDKVHEIRSLRRFILHFRELGRAAEWDCLL